MKATPRPPFLAGGTLEWGAERGLFRIDPDADRDRPGPEGADARPDRWRKNVDYLRLKDLALHLLAPRPGMAVLDVGCANGAQMVYCGLLGAEVHGQDLDPSRVAEANDKLSRLGLAGRAQVADVRTLRFEDGRFDAVLSSDFHEHLDAPAQVAVLREILRVLRPGGILVLKTPNLAYLRLSLNFKRLRALLRHQDPRGYVIPHAPGTSDPEHVGLLTRWDLSRQLAEAGFLNWEFAYAPLRRFGMRPVIELASSELPLIRDALSEEVVCRAYKPVSLSLFPD